MEENPIIINAATPDNGRHTLYAMPKKFESGREGYFATDKIWINGQRHQVSMIFTKIAPKKKKQKEDKKEGEQEKE